MPCTSKKERVTRRTKREMLVGSILAGERSLIQMIAADPKLHTLRSAISADFLYFFEKGQQAYERGQWPLAQKRLQQSLRFCRDQPAQTLLEFMETFAYQAPADWRGYRELRSK